MLKTISFILLVFILTVMFITPVRNFLNSLFHRDKSELREEQIIGKVAGYNPRVEEIQQILRDVGFDPGPIDGMMGGQTRRAIREFQKKKGLKPTGKIDSMTYPSLNREKEVTVNLKKEEPLSFAIGESPKDIKSKEEILKIMGPQGEEIQEELPKNKTKQIQIALKKAGFYKGEADGKIGPKTRRAIVAFQRTKGLKPDGVVGPKTWEELSKYLKD